MRRILRTILILAAVCAKASPAATLPYQGLATDAKGNPRADGAGTAVFALYGAQAADTALWSEAQRISTSKGLFSASLGSATPIPDSLLDGRSLWLGVALDGGAEANPRLALAASPLTKTVADLRNSVSYLRNRANSDSAALKAARDSVQALASLLQLSLLSNNASGIPWNLDVSYGLLYDTRDGQLYRTVKIGTQTWMAQNLDYNVDSSWLYGSSTGSEAKFGRYYKWASALRLKDSCNSKSCAGQVTTPMKGICPTGWHVPSDSEWKLFTTTVAPSGSYGGSKKLWALASWSDPYSLTDAYGFRAVAGGCRMADGTFNGASSTAFFASSTESAAGTTSHRFLMAADVNNVSILSEDKAIAVSLRCVKD